MMTLPVIATCGEATTASNVGLAFVVVTMFPVIAWLATPRRATAGGAPVLDIRLLFISAEVVTSFRAET